MQPIVRSVLVASLVVATIAIVSTSMADVEQDQEAIALEWLKAHNSGDIDAMAEFRAKHFQRSTVEDWQPGYLGFFDRVGQLDVYGVMIEGANRLALGVHSEGTGDRMQLGFSFHADAPDQIREIGLVSTDGGEDDDSGGADGLPPLELGSDWESRKPVIHAYLESLARDGVLSGGVLIADRVGVRFEGAYGLASREFDVANNLDTRFDVGSCNKDYTRIAILQLKAQGKLSAEDTVGKHLPSYPNADVRERVTIQHLLDHRSGLGDYFDEDWRNTPMSRLREIEDYLPIWAPKPLLSEPGERERYSNFGYTVLGAIIEKLSGQSYSDYVVQHVFEPAGMTRSGFFATDAIVPNVAVGYTYLSFDGRMDEPTKNIYVEPAKGGPWGKSYSTVRDLYRFYDAMMRGKILDVADNWLAGGWDRGGFALGGAGPGLNAMVVLEDGIMVVVMVNTDPPIAERVAMKLSSAVLR